MGSRVLQIGKCYILSFITHAKTWYLPEKYVPIKSGLEGDQLAIVKLLPTTLAEQYFHTPLKFLSLSQKFVFIRQGGKLCQIASGYIVEQL